MVRPFSCFYAIKLISMTKKKKKKNDVAVEEFISLNALPLTASSINSIKSFVVYELQFLWFLIKVSDEGKVDNLNC